MLLSGRDLVGLATTGSGKTVAYLVPLVAHCAAQPGLGPTDGPIGVVLVPTRELAAQVHAEARRLARALGLSAVLLAGGTSKWEQTKLLAAGAAIVVATPGRLLEHLRDRTTNLARVSFLVLDEADRMLDMGFRRQVAALLAGVRPDRQCALFSATFPRRVQALAGDAVNAAAVTVTMGAGAGVANAHVAQEVHVVPAEGKWPWLAARAPGLLAAGRLLVFVATRAAADTLMASLNGLPALRAMRQPGEAEAQPSGRAAIAGIAASLHGELHQSDRDAVLAAFRAGAAPILVATDLASRGLDIRGVATVVNYDAARDMDTHVHRVGRTGRVGDDGTHEAGRAVTLVMPHETVFARLLAEGLARAGQAVPPELQALARDAAPARGGPRPGGGGGACWRGGRGGAVGGVHRDGSWAGQQRAGHAPGLGSGDADEGSGGIRLPAPRAAPSASLSGSFPSYLPAKGEALLPPPLPPPPPAAGIDMARAIAAALAAAASLVAPQQQQRGGSAPAPPPPVEDRLDDDEGELSALRRARPRGRFGGAAGDAPAHAAASAAPAFVRATEAVAPAADGTAGPWLLRAEEGPPPPPGRSSRWGPTAAPQPLPPQPPQQPQQASAPRQGLYVPGVFY